MEKLFAKFVEKLDGINQDFIRDFVQVIDWNNRLIGIKGARGVGKTTLILQYIQVNLPVNQQVIYVSLDDIFFSGTSLVDLADTFVKRGGEYLFLDEVHRYKNWSAEIKNIYDDHNKLKIVFTGSSVAGINRSQADLSRRAIIYQMPGLSFREYLRIKSGLNLPQVSLEDILRNHIEICRNIVRQTKPLAMFQDYLVHGYYPYFLENEKTYLTKLAQVIMLSLETDLPYAFDINFSSIEKVKKLLFVISGGVPFRPNIQKLSEKIGIHRNTIIQFLHYLEDLNIVNLLQRDTQGISKLQKPEKIYLHHPNHCYALTNNEPERGMLRETFFYNQLSVNHQVEHTETGDFKVNNLYVFEVGGKNKPYRQIQGITDSFIASDDIEYGFERRIPLWLFGFLY